MHLLSQRNANFTGGSASWASVSTTLSLLNTYGSSALVTLTVTGITPASGNNGLQPPYAHFAFKVGNDIVDPHVFVTVDQANGAVCASAVIQVALGSMPVMVTGEYRVDAQMTIHIAGVTISAVCM